MRFSAYKLGQYAGQLTPRLRKLGQAAAADDMAARLYRAISRAETGSEKDPFIRTRYRPKGGSTAYGPAQVTNGLFQDFLTGHDFKDAFSTDERNYLRRALAQASKFRWYGNEPNKAGYHPMYDYGGAGELANAADRAMYQQVVTKGIGRMLKKYPTPEALALRWRDRTPQQDPRWYGEFRKALGE